MDPRLAAELVKMVDERVEQLMRAQPVTAYGVVASVDAAGGKCSVYVSGNPVASPGFSYPSGMVPAVGHRVRVVTDPRGDRYVAYNLSDPPRLRYVPLNPLIQIYATTTVTANIVATDVELTGLPANVVEAIYCVILLKSTAVPTNDARATLQGSTQGVGYGITAYGPLSVANRWQSWHGLIVPDGANRRTVMYDYAGAGFGTLSMTIRALGYFTRD
jgi:hypothetical protein